MPQNIEAGQTNRPNTAEGLAPIGAEGAQLKQTITDSKKDAKTENVDLGASMLGTDNEARLRARPRRDGRSAQRARPKVAYPSPSPRNGERVTPLVHRTIPMPNPFTSTETASMLTRRSLLAAAAVAPLAAPSLARAAGSTTMKFIPQSDLTILDPLWTTAYVTRNHGLMVFDTLYGGDASYTAQPQMIAGHTVGNDGREWRMTLRPGLKFHDGTPVLARDCVASIKRWGKRDTAGQTVLAYTDELSAADDKTIVFKLKQPLALLPDMLGKVGGNICAIMPERLGQHRPVHPSHRDGGQRPVQVHRIERMVGSLIAYEKFADYVPRRVAPQVGRQAQSVSFSTVSNGTQSPTSPPQPPRCRARRGLVGTVSADMMPLLKTRNPRSPTPPATWAHCG